MVKRIAKSIIKKTIKATALWFFATGGCCFSTLYSQPQKKSWTILIYMAAYNDLARFASKNIVQMQQVGSTENAHIIANYNGTKDGQKKSIIYEIKKNESVVIQEYIFNQDSVDGGDPQTLIRFCQYAITNYPADNYALIFWNHGTGILEPTVRYRTPYLQLFSLNNTNHTKKATKSNKHSLPIATKSVAQKGICFDDGTGNFLTETDLVDALTVIQNTVLHKQFDLIGFDACLMGMIEIATSLSPFAHYFVASQEVELGWGWNYELVLKPFTLGTIRPKTFGAHIVNAYAKTYESLDDYALSLINLEKVNCLKRNVHEVAQLSATLLSSTHKPIFKNIIRLSRNKHFCTHFDEPSFIDLAHFYQNMITYSENYNPRTECNKKLWQQLLVALQQGLELMPQTVLHNKTGKKAPKAQGLSIYFPEQAVHHSYIDSSFAQSTAWLSFLNLYLQGD